MIGLLAVLGLIVFAYILFGIIFGTIANIIGFVLTILVWIFIGYLAGQLIRGKGYGPLGDAALGIGGGIVGSIILRIIGQTNWDNNLIGNIVVGTIGAVVLVFLVRFVNKEFGK
ncbi:MAG: GlsB/YeaQ/YmgE family stress response membrane protein [Anaerolineae bacterium]|jgi:uncharacterized membrane protein YeaQ/YmgE (transglycosylase-associated protein family)|nr:GlsB/YeaQ/YmgE family stress response membrane protein [Anaerolineae bacterium]